MRRHTGIPGFMDLPQLSQNKMDLLWAPPGSPFGPFLGCAISGHFASPYHWGLGGGLLHVRLFSLGEIFNKVFSFVSFFNEPITSFLGGLIKVSTNKI